MKAFWCENCNHRWKEEERAKKCPKCGELVEIHETYCKQKATEEAEDK